MNRDPQSGSAAEAVEKFRAVSGEILRLLNELEDVPTTLRHVATALRAQLGFAAVGIRLQDGEDFPYFVQEGFTDDFLKTENSLVAREKGGGTCRNPDGSVCLECTCGLVLTGQTDPTNPLFTKGGSCWTNDSFPLLELPASQDPRLNPRNNCIHQGYASVALVPIRNKSRIVGLLQLNDHRPGRFSLEIIEILEGIAAHIGAAMMRRLAEEELRRANDELERRVAERTDELRVANVALQASEQRLRELFGSMTEGFVLGEIITDAAGHPVDWRTLESNQAMEHLTGVPTAERLAKTARQIAPDMESFWIDVFGKVALTGEPASFEHYGTITRRHWQMTVFCPGRGRFGALYKDITDRKRAEEDRLMLSKLESTGVLAGGIAHDYNNILTAIILGLDIAQSRRTSPDEVARTLRTIREAALSAQSLTQQLITFAQGGAAVRRPTALDRILRDATRFALSGSAMRCDCSIAADLWLVDLEESQIEQVFRNLVLNAREAMSGEGAITIRADNTVLGSGEIKALPPGNYVRICVSDQGRGIAPEHLSSIFDPYFSTKQRGTQKGMGLGLTICHSVIQKHGGAILVDSTLNVGTTLQIYLPASAEAVPVVAAPPSPAPTPRATGRILVMDDEFSVRTGVAMVLKQIGCEVAVAADGAEAVDLYEKALAAGAGFSAVILDLTVRGGMGGEEALRLLLRRDPAIKAIVMSGYTNNQTLQNYTLHGFKEALIKPFTLEDLQSALARVLQLPA